MRDVLALVFICWIVFEITSILGPLLPSRQTKSKPITPMFSCGTSVGARPLAYLTEFSLRYRPFKVLCRELNSRYPST